MDFRKFDHDTYILIDRYLRNKMTDEEIVDFEIKLSLDPQLENAIKLRRLMIEAIRFRRKKELKEFLKRNSGIRFSGNIWGKNFTRFSAFLIILTGLLLIFTDPEDPRHAPEKTEPKMDHFEENDTINN